MRDNLNKQQKLLLRDNPGEFRKGSLLFSNQQTILEFWHANIEHQKTKHRISKQFFTCYLLAIAQILFTPAKTTKMVTA